MDLASFMDDLANRLEGSADLVDDLANSVWVASEELRDRLFTVEAQLWRVSRHVKNFGSREPDVVAHCLEGIRDALRECVELRACDDDDAVAQMESLVEEKERILSVLARWKDRSSTLRVAGGGS